MSTDSESSLNTNSVQFKYSFAETSEWAKKDNEVIDDGISVLYIFGALAFLIIFTALIMMFSSEKTGEAPVSTVNISEHIESETDMSTSEIQSEFDLLEDAPKEKRSIEAAKK